MVSFFALLITGVELIISHPRFYWGETGNSGTTPLFSFHIPASRDTVPTGYNYTMPDQNGWSRYLHFEAAWVLVITALIYGFASLLNGHFRRNLLPAPNQRSGHAVRAVFARYFRRGPPGEDESRSYNVVQRLSYLLVIFVLFPLIILDRAGSVSRASTPHSRSWSTRSVAGSRQGHCISSSPTCSSFSSSFTWS